MIHPASHDNLNQSDLDRGRPRSTSPIALRAAKELAGATVTLKLKTADFRLRTRARSLHAPTQLAATRGRLALLLE